MKVACIFITLDRLDLTLKCINQNFYNSHLNADVFLIDNGSTSFNIDQIIKAYPFTTKYLFPKNQGIATAINKGINLAKGYDAIVTLANDILMPEGWLLKMVETAKQIPNTGMAGIHCVEGTGTPETINGITVNRSFTAFGNVLIPMKAIKTIGYFNTRFGVYGMEDGDYAYRLNKSGFVNYYIPNMRSEHIGHDVGNVSEYRKMKDESLDKAAEIYTESILKYDKAGDYYLPLKQNKVG